MIIVVSEIVLKRMSWRNSNEQIHEGEESCLVWLGSRVHVRSVRSVEK